MPVADQVLRGLEELRAGLGANGLPGGGLVRETIDQLTQVLGVWTRAEQLGWPAVTGGRRFFIRGGPADWQAFLDNAEGPDRERAAQELDAFRERQSQRSR
jgi:hypothetical protein